MTRLQPNPVAFAAPAAKFDLSDALLVKQVLKQHDIDTFKHISLAQFLGKSYFRVGGEAHLPARYFDTNNGQELALADEQYAKILASHFTGRVVDDISKIELINRFSDDYHAVNRLLPVWRIEFSGDQHLRAFVDTEQSRLSTLVNDTRYWLTLLFRFGHNWSFLDGAPELQLTLAALILSAVLTSSFSGLYLYFRFSKINQRLENQPLRRWHRRLGLLVSFSALVFAASGMFHLVMSYQQQIVAIEIKPEAIFTHQLEEQAWQHIVVKPLAKLDLISHAGVPYWYVLAAAKSGKNQMPVAQVAALKNEAEYDEHHDHHAHVNNKEELVLPYLQQANLKQNNIQQNSIESLARLQVATLAKRPVSELRQIEWVTKFENEYGFIFKRLPVIKVQTQGDVRYYIEPATGVLAANVSNIDGLEGLVFTYLHKWSLENLNKDLRDMLVSLFALSNIIVALFGLLMFQKYYATLKSTI